MALYRSVFRTLCRSFAPILVGSVALVLVPVSLPQSGAAIAQDIGAWGVWGNWNDERGRRHKAGRSVNTPPGQAPAGSSNFGYSNSPNKGRVFPALLNGGPRPVIELVAPDIVRFANFEEPGTIVIDTKARRLYYTLNSNSAYSYPISVGRVGYTWTGVETISRIADWPDWHPPKEMREREPGLPVKMTGGLRNPLGAVAIYLGDTLYRIHGTNDPKTIGRAASSGCFRMLNHHVAHLARLAYVGTKVKIVARIEDLHASTQWDASVERAGG